MAKILVAFYNCITDEKNENAMPIFYESFINGLDAAGNEVAVFSHREFGKDFGELDIDTKKYILNFNPDICIIFNNSFYDLAEIVSCPIVIYEVDSPRYFSNKQSIKDNRDRYLFFIFQIDSKITLMKEFGISENQIFYAPFFSEIHSDSSVEQVTNISFIGSRFTWHGSTPFTWFAENNPTQEEWKFFHKCVNEIRRNPQVTPTELIYKFEVTSELVARSLNLGGILQALSDEKRLRVLSSVSDLGLELYGTTNWKNEYYFNIDLNFAFQDRQVYSFAHNQEIYNKSKIGISVSHLQATSGFPWRVIDIMASNACLVTDKHSDFNMLFPEVVDVLPMYETPYEAYEVCKKLLEDEPRRNEIVQRCNTVIDERFRFKNLLLKIEEYTGVRMH